MLKHLSCLLFLLLCFTFALSSPPSASAASRGYFTSISELQHSKSQVQSGNQVAKDRLDALLRFLREPAYWPYGTINGSITAPASGTCSSLQDVSGPDFLKYNEGARLVYGKVLAYHYTGNEAYAVSAREKILDLTDTTSYGGELYNGANQCVLELAFSLPIWIQSADLLSESPVWSAQDTQQFQTWLAREAYPKVAWASRARANNWGAAGSTATVMIADYVSNSTLQLPEVKPIAKTLTPAQAYQEHVQQAKDRAIGVFKGDSQCPVWGVQSYGGIPDELRRGTTGCTAQGISAIDNSLVYQITYTDFLILLAEVMWHRGDTSFYDLKSADGKGSVKQAIHFVVHNPQNAAQVGWEEYRLAHLFLPRRYYKDALISASAEAVDEDAEGTFIPFAHLTHLDQNTTPPVVVPPQVRTCHDADINSDGVVNVVDFSLLVRDFFKSSPTNPRSDINRDSAVNLFDYSLLSRSFFVNQPC